MSHPIVKHRCEQWKDLRIHPECAWLWGTQLEFHRGPVKSADGEKRDFWVAMDDTSETYSLYNGDSCPFCKVSLSTLLP